jgi:L-fuconolactonase
VLHDEADPFYMLQEDFQRGIRELKRYGLAYDILIFERHLPQTIRFVDHHPDQIFIVDHLAKPRVKARELSPWRENIRELARRPNVYCKVSGLITEADQQKWRPEDLEPYLQTVLSAFGPKRLLFGSDWPVCLLAGQYKQWISVVEQALSRLSSAEQEWVWSCTAQLAYRLS